MIYDTLNNLPNYLGVSDFDESAVTAPTPAQLVEQLAIGKCLAVRCV